MDKRSWPWKKKSSEKQVAEKSLAIVSGIPTSPPNVAATQADQVCQYYCLQFFYLRLRACFLSLEGSLICQ